MTLNRLPTWWDDQVDGTTAETVAVTAGSTTTGIDALLQLGGEIQGTLTSTVTGKGIAGVCVEASSSTVGPDLTAAGPVVRTTATGTYLLRGLASGSYIVEFEPCGEVNTLPYALPVLWGATGDLTTTPAVQVTAGQITSGISRTLQPGGSVSGVVTSATSGKPIAGACVLVESTQYGGGYSEAATGPSGTYLVRGLLAGEYGAAFFPCQGQNYLAAPWHDGTTFAVKASTVTDGISGVLATGGEITGTITSASGVPLTGLCIVLTQKSSTETSTIMEAPEGFAGSFAMVGLSEGRYSVGFSGGCVDANYATTYWRGGASVQVKPGTVVSGIELRLAAGGQITGTVTSSRGVGLSGVCVLVTSSNPTENLAVNFTLTFGGSYDAVGLPSGSYSVFFVPCGQDQNYLEMDYGSSVGVDIGKVTSGISAVLLNGAEIEGTVISASGTSLSDICVAAASASDVRK